MSNSHINTTHHQGIFSSLQARLHKNRLGELLVLDGVLTPFQLKHALCKAHENGQSLGQLLVEDHLVSSSLIQRTLAEQFILRLMMATMAVLISIASLGMAKRANAGQLQDAPARISLVHSAFDKASHQPALFGSIEKESHSLKAFTKWTDMFQRFNATLNASSEVKEVQQFRSEIQDLKNLPLNKMAENVNEIMNAKRYISDSANYGQTDYWATPIEFFKRGGDCEDYAIAKYTALRVLGVPESRLRIAIVQDMQKNIPHAILVVYTDQGAIILDNQIKRTVKADNIKHYKPIFSINQDAWWLHTAPRPSVTVVATAAQ